MISKKIIKFISSITILSTVLTGCNLMDEAKQLGLNLSKGEQFVVETKANITSKISANGMSFDMPMKMDMNSLIDIKSVGDNEISADYSIDFIKMNASVFGMEMNIDTTQDTEEAKELKEIINDSKFSMTLNGKGEVTGFTIPDSFKNNSELQQTGFNKDQLNSLLNLFPKDAKDIKVGSDWTIERKQNVGVGKEVSYKETLKVTKIEGEKIYVDSTISGDMSTEEMKNIKIEGSGTYILLTNSFAESAKYTLTMKGDDVDLGDGLKASMEIKMDMEANIKKK